MNSKTLMGFAALGVLAAAGAQAADLGTITITGGDRYNGYNGVAPDGNAYQYYFKNFTTAGDNAIPTGLAAGLTGANGKHNISPYWIDATAKTPANVTINVATLQEPSAPVGTFTSQVNGLAVSPTGATNHPFGDSYYNQTGITTTTYNGLTTNPVGVVAKTFAAPSYTSYPNEGVGSVITGPKNTTLYTPANGQPALGNVFALQTVQKAFGASDVQSEQLAALEVYLDKQLKTYGAPVTWTGYYQGAATPTGSAFGPTQNYAMNVIAAAAGSAALDILGFNNDNSLSNTPGNTVMYSLSSYNAVTNPYGTCAPGAADCMNMNGWVQTALTYAQTHATANVYAVAAVTPVATQDLIVGVETHGAVVLSPTAIADVSVPGGTAAVPEPAAWTLMLLGVGGLGAMLRRRRALARKGVLLAA